jgi:hypothetical protein
VMLQKLGLFISIAWLKTRIEKRNADHMTDLISSSERPTAGSHLLEAVVISAAMAILTLVIPLRCNAQLPASAASPVEAAHAGSTLSGPAESILEKTKNEFGVWAGGSLGLPAALGGSRDRKIPFLLGFRYGRVLAAGKYLALEYTIDVVPVAVVSGPKGGFSNPGGLPSPGSGRDYAYGAGVIPVGFKVFVAPEHRIKPYLTVSSGPFYFSKQVPVPNSAQFNFLSTAGGGVQIFVSSRRSITVEYRIGHLSNAGVGNLNPGFNGSTIQAGFSVFR